jgi:hypothetical protein
MSQVKKETEVIFGARNKNQVLEKQELYVKDDAGILQPVNPNNLLNGGGGISTSGLEITIAGADAINPRTGVAYISSEVDYLCDSTDDEVEINQAITKIKLAGGGTLKLTGTFNTNSAISTIDFQNCHIIGVGKVLINLTNPISSNGDENVMKTMSIENIDAEISDEMGGYSPFNYCSNLTNCTATAQSYAFENCNNLENCTGTSETYAFLNCNNLENCTATGPFNYCSNLTNCTGTATEWGYTFENCNNLTNCTATAENNFAFNYCNNLTNCTGTAENNSVFYTCSNLTNCTGTATGNSYVYGNCRAISYCKGTTPTGQVFENNCYANMYENGMQQDIPVGSDGLGGFNILNSV